MPLNTCVARTVILLIDFRVVCEHACTVRIIICRKPLRSQKQGKVAINLKRRGVIENADLKIVGERFSGTYTKTSKRRAVCVSMCACVCARACAWVC